MIYLEISWAYQGSLGFVELSKAAETQYTNSLKITSSLVATWLVDRLLLIVYWMLMIKCLKLSPMFIVVIGSKLEEFLLAFTSNF